VRIFNIPGTSVYLTTTCPFLDRSSAAPTPPLRLCLQPRSRLKTLIADLPGAATIATPAPEGPLTNDQANHTIERLQGIILNNGGGLSPNRGATRQLRPIQPAVGPACHHPTLMGHLIPTALEVDTCTTDTAGCVRPLGTRGMATMVVGRWAPAQGYGGGMGMGHSVYGVAGAGAGAGPSSVLSDQIRR